MHRQTKYEDLAQAQNAAQRLAKKAFLPNAALAPAG
jgi:hypothetical protein